MRAFGSIVAVGLVAVIACAGPMANGQQSSQATSNSQQQRMKSCNAQASAEKLKGDARKSFMSECLSGATAAAGSTSPQRESTNSQQDRMKACNARAKTEKLSGDARKSFMSDCLSGQTRQDTAASQQGTSAPRAERAPQAQTPSPNAGTAGTSQPPPRAAPNPRATTNAAAAGQFATEQEAQRRCPGDTVVWANTESGVYHYAGTRNYGHTKQGAYMCRQDGNRAGYRPAKNEKAPQ